MGRMPREWRWSHDDMPGNDFRSDVLPKVEQIFIRGELAGRRDHARQI